MPRKKTPAKLPTPTGPQFPDLPFDMGADDAKITASDGKGEQRTITVEDLQKQIEEMQAAHKRELEDAHAQSLALMQQAPVVTPQLRSTDVDMDGLPDPVTDPTGYGRELAARTKQALQNEQYNASIQAQQTQTQQQKINALWEDFRELYPDYADERKVQYIATELAEKAAARGRDVNKYLFGTSKIFFADAVKLYDKTFGKPQAEGADTDADDEGSLLDDDGRTGLPGGGPSGRSAAPVDEDKLLANKSMFDGLKQWQMKNGFTI